MSGLKTRYSEFATVTDASKVRDETQRKLAAIDARIAQLTRSLDCAGDNAQALAEKYLGGAELTALRSDAGQVLAELHNARAERQIIAAALEMAESRLADAKDAAIAQLLPAAKAAYSQACTAIAQALIDLRRAVKAEIAFRDTYTTGELRLFPVQLGPQSLAFDAQVPRYFLREAVAAGLVDAQLLTDFDKG